MVPSHHRDARGEDATGITRKKGDAALVSVAAGLAHTSIVFE